MVTLWLRKPPYLYIIWLVLWNIYGSCHHPNALSIIFQDGYVKTTKQIVFIHLNKWLKTGHKNSLFTIVTKFCSMNKWILHGCSRLKNRRFHHSPGSPRIAPRVAGRREGRADGVEGAGETLGETGVAMGSLVVSPKPSLKVNGS